MDHFVIAYSDSEDEFLKELNDYYDKGYRIVLGNHANKDYWRYSVLMELQVNDTI